MNSDTAFNELRTACLSSLSVYFCEANQTCELLVAIEKFPASFRERQAILDQRLRENAAFQDYYSARAKLLGVVCSDGFFSTEPASAHPIPTI